MTVTRQPQALQEAHDTPEERSWAALVRAGGYLSPAQRQAFEKAIALVTDRMRDTLEKPATQVGDRFSLDHYVDSLEPGFKRDAGQGELQGDAALTAFWIVRLMADRLLEAAGGKPNVH